MDTNEVKQFIQELIGQEDLICLGDIAEIRRPHRQQGMGKNLGAYEYPIDYSKLKEWTHAGKLKYTEYDLDENGQENKKVFPAMGTVVTESGRLNLRKKPDTSSTVIDRIPKGNTITLTGYEDGWYSVEYNGHAGYVSSEYVSVSSDAPAKAYVITFTVVNEAMLEELTELLNGIGIAPEIREAGD